MWGWGAVMGGWGGQRNPQRRGCPPAVLWSLAVCPPRAPTPGLRHSLSHIITPSSASLPSFMAGLGVGGGGKRGEREGEDGGGGPGPGFGRRRPGLRDLNSLSCTERRLQPQRGALGLCVLPSPSSSSTGPGCPSSAAPIGTVCGSQRIPGPRAAQMEFSMGPWVLRRPRQFLSFSRLVVSSAGSVFSCRSVLGAPLSGDWGQLSMRDVVRPFWYSCRVICAKAKPL